MNMRKEIYHCGALHWVLDDNSTDSHCIVFSFDLDKEEYYSRSVTISPPSNPQLKMIHPLTMGVLGGYLCLYCNFGGNLQKTHIDIWVMKENNDDICDCECWTKLFSIDVKGYGIYQPISYLHNGALLMFNSLIFANMGNQLIYYDNLEGSRFKYFKIDGL